MCVYSVIYDSFVKLELYNLYELEIIWTTEIIWIFNICKLKTSESKSQNGLKLKIQIKLFS